MVYFSIENLLKEVKSLGTKKHEFKWRDEYLLEPLLTILDYEKSNTETKLIVILKPKSLLPKEKRFFKSNF